MSEHNIEHNTGVHSVYYRHNLRSLQSNDGHHMKRDDEQEDE